jgi:hypothetical protein
LGGDVPKPQGVLVVEATPARQDASAGQFDVHPKYQVRVSRRTLAPIQDRARGLQQGGQVVVVVLVEVVGQDQAVLTGLVHLAGQDQVQECGGVHDYLSSDV